MNYKVTDDESPVYSLIIVTWNSWNDLNRCLHSIYLSDFNNMEIIVIDNASNDDTCNGLNKCYPEVILHRNQENKGHAKGVNQGFRMAQGEYIMVLDVDTELPTNMVNGMLEFMRTHPQASLATPRNLNTDGTIQESSRNLPSIMSGLFGRQSLLTALFPNNPFSRRYLARDYLMVNTPFQVEQISGACMVFPRSLLKEVGSWDESYPGYWVDTDWCAHLKKMGKEIYCVPTYTITHHENNAKGKRKSPRRIWLFHYGAYLLYTKWYCWGVYDPRSVFAAILLTMRATMLVFLNLLKPKPDDSPDYLL